MTPTLVAVLAALLALVGLCGIVVPALPGSITVGLGALVWAVWGSSPWGWWAFGWAAALLVIGMATSTIRTGRDLARREIPRWPVVVGLVCGVAGGFVLPALGLPIGFVLGLFCCELVRVRSLGGAVNTSLVAVKAIGIGMAVELACALTATAVLTTSILTAVIH